MKKNKKQFPWIRFIPIVLLLIGLFAFFYFRLYEYINFQTLKMHRTFLLEWTNQHFLFSTIIFISTYIIMVAISAPGAVFLTIIGGFLFGPLWGTLYVAIGATIGAILIFFAAKTAFHDVLYQKAGKWFREIEKGFKDNVISYMLFLRLVPLFPFWLVNIVPAFLGVSIRIFSITTFFGILPGTFVYVLLGNGLGVLLEQGKTPDLSIIFKPEIFIPLLGLGILSLIPILYKRIKHVKQNNKN